MRAPIGASRARSASSPERSDWTRDSEFGSGAAHSDSTQQSPGASGGIVGLLGFEVDRPIRRLKREAATMADDKLLTPAEVARSFA
jgi:hypothetical protein